MLVLRNVSLNNYKFPWSKSKIKLEVEDEIIFVCKWFVSFKKWEVVDFKQSQFWLWECSLKTKWKNEFICVGDYEKKVKMVVRFESRAFVDLSQMSK